MPGWRNTLGSCKTTTTKKIGLPKEAALEVITAMEEATETGEEMTAAIDPPRVRKSALGI